jgi:Mrp family chromosome partitioning ATPase
LAVLVDGVVLVVRYGQTRRDQLQQAATALKQVGATTSGVVLNMVPQKAELTRAYGYEYSAGYAPENND